MCYLGSKNLQFLAELDHLLISNYYEMVEMNLLGHYHPSTIQNIKRFIQPFVTSKSTINRQILDSAATINVTCSQKIFMARNCCVWFADSLM